MKVVDVCREVALLLGDKKLISLIENKVNNGDDNFTAEELKKIDEYLHSFNFSVRSIASEDAPIYYIEKVKSDAEGKVLYDSLLYEVYRICQVVDKSQDKRVQFLALPFSVYLPSIYKEYFVKYSYLPTKVNSISDSIDLPSEWTSKMISFYMASDMLLKKASYDEYSFFKKEYIKSLSNAFIKCQRGKVLPSKKLI